jgi:hypothetical protein
MDRRLFIQNTLKTVAAVSAVAASGSVISAQKTNTQRLKLKNDRIKLQNRNLLKINYKGRSFHVSRGQNAALRRLSPSLRSRLRAPRKGEKILSVGQLNELKRAEDIMRKHREKFTMSTIMCPW